ncbi:MAG: glycosyltransferase [Clostridia bacterium]
MEQKIPKIIHYVWVGRKPKSEKIQKCMESWKRFCPDYEIKEWNEDNIDFESNAFIKEAYENKKFAFVSDYARLYALFNEGGIYMDTDVELTKPLDEFLIHNAFSGFENAVWIPTAVMGSEKGHSWTKLLLDYYKNRHFVNNGKMDLTTNVDIISALTKIYYDIELNNKNQQLKDGLYFYSNDYFCPKNYVSEKIELTENTHAIHHFAGSWLSPKLKRVDKLVKFIKKIFGDKIFMKIENHFFRSHAKKFCKKLRKEYQNKK